MFKTKYGTYDGDSWEELCQQVFKSKYGPDGYQEMVSSPGDYGIEGFTKYSGMAFQCYCPDRNYPSDVLYEKCRDKITRDLKKLRQHSESIEKRLGETKISQWIFVTPEIHSNDLLSHARTKEQEVRNWGLNYLSDDFTVLLKDAVFFAREFHKINAVNGVALSFDTETPQLPILEPDTDEQYQSNIVRKSTDRLTASGNATPEKIRSLNEITFKKWLDFEATLKKIDDESPVTYQTLSRIINYYEGEIDELNITWTGTPEELISKIRKGLAERLDKEMPTLAVATRQKIADQMISRWLAICTVDFI